MPPIMLLLCIVRGGVVSAIFDSVAVGALLSSGVAKPCFCWGQSFVGVRM